MKIAIILAGQLRFLENILKHQSYIKDLNCDIFITTDNFDFKTKTIISREKIFNYAKKILGNQLKDFYNEEKHINFLLNLHNDGNSLKTYEERSSTSLFSGREAVCRLILKGYELIENYENKNNIKYDIIIRTRSDLVFSQSITPFFKHINSIEDLIVLKREYPLGIHICDNFIICSRKSAKKYANVWHSIRTFRPPSPEQKEDKELKEKNIGCNFACMEKQTYRHIKKNNLKFFYMQKFLPNLKHYINRGNNEYVLLR